MIKNIPCRDTLVKDYANERKPRKAIPTVIAAIAPAVFVSLKRNAGAVPAVVQRSAARLDKK